jgi:type IV secretion system protein VirB6
VLTSLLTIFVAIFGYRLLLGRAQLRISDLALTMVKLGAVLALATRWDVYQALVYNALFQGPAQLASGMLGAVQPEGSAFRGNVFDGLQRAFDQMTFFAGEYAKQVPTTAAPSPLLGGVGFGAMALTLAATTLLLTSLGVLLAAKVVLALLLAVGPIFIVLLLFDATRGCSRAGCAPRSPSPSRPWR